MKNTYCTFTMVLLLATTCFSQTQHNPDTLQANSYYSKGDSLLRAADYDNSIIYFKQAAAIYKKAAAWEAYFKSRNRLSKGYWRAKQYDQALQIAENVKDESSIKLGECNSVALESYYNIGSVFYHKKHYKKALAYMHRALNIYTACSSKPIPLVASIYSAIGIINRKIYMYDSALLYYNKALQMRKEEGDSVSTEISNLYNNMANVYEQIGNFKLCLNFHFMALAIRKVNLNEFDPVIASSYSNIGMAYKTLGAFDMALEYHHKALLAKKKWYGEVHIKVAHSYNNIGILNRNKGNYEIALDFYRKRLAIVTELLGTGHSQVAGAYNNMGIVYYIDGNYGQAFEYYQKAITILEEIPDVNPINLSHPYHNSANAYFEQGQYDLALQYYEKTLALRKARLPDKNQEIASVYRSTGEVFMRKQDYIQSLSYYQKGLIANVYDFEDTSIYSNPSLNSVLDNPLLLESFQKKAQSFEKLSQQNGNLKDLKFALYTLQLCDTLIDQMRQSYLQYEDKKTLAKTASEVYENAVRVSLNLYDKTNDKNYLEYAFYFAEKNKSGILTESLNALTAKKTGLLPDNLVDLEQTLKIDQAFYQSQVNGLQSEKDGYDTALFQYNTDRLFYLNRQKDSLILAFEKDYPDYYRMKYENTTISPEKIQQKLPEKTALIEYFVGDSSLYTFTITREGYKIFNTPITSDFQDQISALRINLDQSRKEAPSAPVTAFISVANKLGDKLLSKPLAYLSNQVNIDHLVIIPDGKLSYIPFELLLTNEIKEDQKNFKQLPYLINDYSISYGYSASLIFNQSPQKKGNYSSSYIGYAPAYTNNLKNTASVAIAGNFRNEITSLAWNQDEVLNIAKEMNGSSLVAAAATETSFKTIAKDHGILHLAMHALVDDKDPMNSKLVFTQSNDTINDGFLHAYEIFNMELNAQMVVLSACNTGFGKLEKGEGVASLGYAFSYAGCPSVVMSHWPVNDYSTKEIMLSFYRYLEAGYAKDKALQLAKIDFLKTAEGELANPAYWAPFVLIGNDDPIELQENNSAKFIFVFLAIAGLLTLFLFLRYTNNKSRNNLVSVQK